MPLSGNLIRCNGARGRTFALLREAPGLTRRGGTGLTLHRHLHRGGCLTVGSTSVAVRGFPGQSGEIHRGIHVPVEDEAAGGAGVRPFREGEFGFHRTTPGTGHVAGEPTVRDDHPATTPGGLALDLAAELRERRERIVRDVPGRPGFVSISATCRSSITIVANRAVRPVVAWWSVPRRGSGRRTGRRVRGA